MLVVWLRDPACQVAALTGGKAGNLARLAVAYPVPAGFCVTAEAYRRWADAGKPAVIPADVLTSLAQAYETLPRHSGAPARVAVRSSAIGEDGHEASFAGQYATYLNVSGIDLVAEAVARCWADADSERVHAYRRRQGNDSAEPPVAVLVQQLVMADVAFVAFSAHPITGDRGEVVINSNWGLGESIVEGAVVPDTYVVRKSDRSLISETIGEKERMTIMQPDGVRVVKVPRGLRSRASLTADQAGSIAALATRLEDEMRWPVDIEGAYQDDSLYLLQCRPITTV